MLDNILAKSEPEEKLTEHTENALNVWREIYLRYKDVMNVDDNFWHQSFLSVLFHDSGKIIDNFQNVINKTEKYQQEKYIRHEFLSSVFLLLSDTKNYKKNSLPVFAVMSHHKPLSDEIFSDDSQKNLKINTELLKEFIGFSKVFVNNECNKSFNFDERLYDYFQNVTLSSLYLSLKEKFFKEGTASLNMTNRKTYIFYKAILQLSDWLASGHNSLAPVFNYDKIFLQKKIIKNLANQGKIKIANSFEYLEFQKQSEIDANVIAIAPTGSGKTEASLIWASQKKDISKILYLLPTRVTSNAIYKRLCNYFGEENTAIIHSSAYFFKKEINDTYSRKDYLYDKNFFKSINVCTIDQVLTQGFNLGFWELKTFHSFKAKIIIDEIHLYHPYTLGLIISTIKYLISEFDASFYIMSATMPKKLKEILQETIATGSGNVKIIEDLELLNEARNIFEVRENTVDELDEEIKSSIKDYKRVLIVVNTVNEAIRLYEKYKSDTKNIICYHSRFIQKDRIKKEEDILTKEKNNDPVVLIATQVVEVSLDIDFDILFTENAPIDAIIQRAGRVNRKRKKQNSKVIVFKENEITRKWVYDEPNILENTFSLLTKNSNKKLSENKLSELVDKVYKDMDIQSNEHFFKGINMYNKIYENLNYIKDNLNKDEVYTREGLNTINVIPDCFYEELQTESIEIKAKYELSVSKSKECSFEIIKDDDGFRYIKAFYDYETGLSFDKNKNKKTSVFL